MPRSRDLCIESQDEIDTTEQELEQGKSRSSKLDREGSLAVFQGLVGGVTSVPTTGHAPLDDVPCMWHFSALPTRRSPLRKRDISV